MIPYQSWAEHCSIMVPAQFSLPDIAINSTSLTSFAYKLRKELPTSLQKLAEQNPNPRNQLGNLLFMMLLRVVFKYQRPTCAHTRKHGTSQGTMRIHRWSWQHDPCSLAFNAFEPRGNCFELQNFQSAEANSQSCCSDFVDDKGRDGGECCELQSQNPSGKLENPYPHFTSMLMIGILWRRR